MVFSSVLAAILRGSQELAPQDDVAANARKGLDSRLAERARRGEAGDRLRGQAEGL